MASSNWYYLDPFWWPWRRAYDPTTGKVWRVSFWMYPTTEETIAAEAHDDAYLEEQRRRQKELMRRRAWWRRSRLRRLAADRRFINSLPEGKLKRVCQTPLAKLIFMIGWKT